MSLIHILKAFSEGGLTGCQIQQRDWSPFIVHFTSWNAMRPFRELFKSPPLVKASNQLPQFVDSALNQADEISFQTFLSIIQSGYIRANSPSEKDDIPPCVCFSECNLPGLIGHCERYGRFGFVFSKSDIFANPSCGRPCLYVDSATYTVIDKDGSQSASREREYLFGLSNVYSPVGAGHKIQDFSHEREWRVFSNVPLSFLRAVLCPLQYHAKVLSSIMELRNTNLTNTMSGKLEQRIAPDSIPVIPIDMLFEWGA